MQRPPPPSPAREPLRVVVLAGVATLILGSLLPWAAGRLAIGLPVSFDGFQGPGDGLLLLSGAAVIAVLVISRTAAEARTRTFQLLPLVAALGTAFLWWVARGHAVTVIEGWRIGGGSGQLEPGIWLAGIGACVAAGGMLVITVRQWRRVAPDPDPTLRGSISGADVARGFGALFGAVLGGAAVLASGAAGGGVAASLVLFFVVPLAALLGGRVGSGVAGWLVRSVARRGARHDARPDARRG